MADHAIVSHLEPLSDTDEVYVSIATVYEFECRVAKAPTTLKPRIREQITAIRKDFAVLPLSETGADIFGELKNHLQTVRGIKPENLKKYTIDLILVANAIATQAVLVSTDQLFTDL